MKHSLQLKLSQHLALTPQLQQSIRLLQLSTLELDQELDQIVQDNPLLERIDRAYDEGALPAGGAPAGDAPAEAETAVREEESSRSGADDVPEINWGDAPSHANRDDDDDYEALEPAAQNVTLLQHLELQLKLTQLSERDKQIVWLLVAELNEDGYLTQSLEELIAILPPELVIEPIELETALKHLQHLDPPGVGARNLSECLVLQIESMPSNTPYCATALAIVREHLETLAGRDYGRLKRLLACDDAALRGAQQLIKKLNPRPAAGFMQYETHYVVPDVTVKKVKGLWIASLNTDAMPRLRINRIYADILQRNRDSSSQHLTSQLQEAKWLIKNIQQRFDTILRVSQAIVDRQRLFFSHGEVAMRPLVLREIADAVELHESTVSRVTTHKYMFTPRGIFELKYFFGSHVTTDSGGSCSATAIRALIKQLVGSENPKKPYSDHQIVQILAQQGITVARRTIAKYRESLQIPAVNLRKTI
ncbi:MAG: RNA polymerase factor sigma-54 [Burkholderiales bacterium]